jgi:hypothetical protein
VTYSLDALFVKSNFDIEVFEVLIRLGTGATRLLMHSLSPRSIHLVILLRVLELVLPSTCSLHLHLLLHLHHLHALHLGCIILIVNCLLLGLVLLILLLLALGGRHALLTLVLLLAVLVVVVLVACCPLVFISHLAYKSVFCFWFF